MNSAMQGQEAQGSNLQNTENLQQGEQAGGLQPQSSYRQVQQEALGSDAYRNFDGLRVENAQGGNTATVMPKRQFGTNSHAWPSVWVWVGAVLVFIVFINIRNNIKKASKRTAVASHTKISPETTDSVEPVPSETAKELGESPLQAKTTTVASSKPKAKSKAKPAAKKAKKSAKKSRK